MNLSKLMLTRQGGLPPIPKPHSQLEAIIASKPLQTKPNNENTPTMNANIENPGKATQSPFAPDEPPQVVELVIKLPVPRALSSGPARDPVPNIDWIVKFITQTAAARGDAVEIKIVQR